MAQIAIPLSRHFDHILTRIEAGNVDQGVSHLAGLLDAVLIGPGCAAATRRCLLAHPLGRVLDQPRLAASIESLGLTRAAHARAQLAQATLELAQRNGERLLVLARGESLPGRPADPVAAPFDLILAPHWPDQIPGEELNQAIADAAVWLGPRGRLVTSAFVPGHLGSGWQAIWLDRPVRQHDPDALGAAARLAGLTPRLFHDASGCLVWAELRRVAENSITGGLT